MDETPWVDVFEAYAGARFAELSAADPRVVGSTRLAPGRHRVPLADWEAEWFMRGVSHELFGVVPYECRASFHAARYFGDFFRSRKGKLRDAHFFGATGGGRRVLSRETVTAVAAMTRLVLGYGHSRNSVHAESDHWEVDAEAFDGPLTDRNSRLILAVEAKVDTTEHEQLVAGMQACRGSMDASTHLRAVPGLSAAAANNHHRKCTYVGREKPATFWMISPESSSVFSTRFDEAGMFELVPADCDLGLGAVNEPATAARERTAHAGSLTQVDPEGDRV